MTARIDYALPGLCWRMNSILVMGTARSRTSSQGFDVNEVWCQDVGHLFMQWILSLCSLSYAPFLRVQLPCVCETLLCRRIRWVEWCALLRSSQQPFLLHQYALMSSSSGTPTCNNSKSKLSLFDTRYAAWINLVWFIYPIAYENSERSCENGRYPISENILQNKKD